MWPYRVFMSMHSNRVVSILSSPSPSCRCRFDGLILAWLGLFKVEITYFNWVFVNVHVQISFSIKFIGKNVSIDWFNSRNRLELTAQYGIAWLLSTFMCSSPSLGEMDSYVFGGAQKFYHANAHHHSHQIIPQNFLMCCISLPDKSVSVTFILREKKGERENAINSFKTFTVYGIFLQLIMH